MALGRESQGAGARERGRKPSEHHKIGSPGPACGMSPEPGHGWVQGRGGLPPS